MREARRAGREIGPLIDARPARRRCTRTCSEAVRAGARLLRRRRGPGRARASPTRPRSWSASRRDMAVMTEETFGPVAPGAWSCWTSTTALHARRTDRLRPGRRGADAEPGQRPARGPRAARRDGEGQRDVRRRARAAPPTRTRCPGRASATAPSCSTRSPRPRSSTMPRRPRLSPAATLEAGPPARPGASPLLLYSSVASGRRLPTRPPEAEDPTSMETRRT